MIAIGVWAWAAGCSDRDTTDSDGAPLDSTAPPTSHTQTLGAGLVLVTDDLADPVIVPCDEVRVARVENRGTEEVVIDALEVTPADEALFGLAEVLEIPRILRPGGTPIAIPMRVAGATPATGRADLELVTEDGTFTATLEVEVAYGEQRTESFVTPLPMADVVLAVDHGGSMEAHRAEFEDAVPRLLSALSDVADWRLVLVTGEDGCNNGGVFTAASADAGDWIADHAFDGEATDEYTDALLELASVALSQNAPSECNEDFQRDHAQLHVIAVSDGPEDSGRSWSHWVDDYHDYADQVRVSAVAALGFCGRADGYEDAAQATGGALLDLCDDGWDREAGALAEAIVEVPPAFVTAAPAVPASIRAEVGGDEVPATWDPERGAVVVPAAAEPGTAVTVHYAVPGECEPLASGRRSGPT